MLIDPTEAASDVALRAMTREPEHRFDPLGCCDGRGRYLGIVAVERLVGRLAAEAPL